MKALTNNVIVVTGASRGIGAAIARAFAKENCKLVLCGRDRDKLDQVAKEIGLPEGHVVTVAAEIRTAEGMKQIVETAYDKFGRVDVFINNAGVGWMKPAMETSEDEYDVTFDTNLKAVFFSFKELIPRMKAQGGGQIINVSSMAGKQGVAGIAVYSASKAALNALCEAVGGEVRYDNIKISVLAPGSTETGFGGRGPAAKAGKMRLQAEEVAQAALFMALQDQNAWVSNVELRPLIPKK
jgi:short-subunit dehydrogenase